MKRSRFQGVKSGVSGDYAGNPERNRRFRARMLQGRQSENVQDRRQVGYPNGGTISWTGQPMAKSPDLEQPVPRMGMRDWDEAQADADEVSSRAARHNISKTDAEDVQPLAKALRRMMEGAEAHVRDKLAREKAQKDYDRKVGKAPEGSAGYGYSYNQQSTLPDLEKKVPIHPWDDPTRPPRPRMQELESPRFKRHKRAVKYKEPR